MSDRGVTAEWLVGLNFNPNPTISFYSPSTLPPPLSLPTTTTNTAPHHTKNRKSSEKGKMNKNFL
jgi:hypothetical protein